MDYKNKLRKEIKEKICHTQESTQICGTHISRVNPNDGIRYAYVARNRLRLLIVTQILCGQVVFSYKDKTSTQEKLLNY